MRREVAAEQWAGDAREAEHRAEDPLVASALTRRDDVADDSLRRHQQPAAAESLDRSKGDEPRHVSAQPAQRRAEKKAQDRALQRALSAVQIAQFSIERRVDCLSMQESCDDPDD